MKPITIFYIMNTDNHYQQEISTNIYLPTFCVVCLSKIIAKNNHNLLTKKAQFSIKVVK